MSDQFENPPSTDSYISAALYGLLAGIGVAAALIVVVGLSVLLGDAGLQRADWSVLGAGFAILAVVGIAGLIGGIPVAVLFVAIMAFAERAHPIARTLPVWLLGGLVAATPLFGLIWYGMQGPGDSVPPFSAVMTPLVLIYAAGLAAAGTAWRMRHRSGL